MSDRPVWLFWDFDGTLAERDGMWTATVHAILVKNGISHIPFAELRPFLNLGFPWDSPETPHALYFRGRGWWETVTGMIASALVTLGLDEKTAAVLAGHVRAEFLRPEKWRLFPDTRPALETARKLGWKSMILSNHVPELPQLVDQLGVADFFEAVISSALVGCEKPDREIFRMAAGHAPAGSRCVMIGDNYAADIGGARRAGLQAVWVRKPNTKEYPRHSPGLEGIFPLIQALWDR